MSDAQALVVLKMFIDQAIGQGLFKNTEDVITAVTALDRLKLSVQEKDALMKQIPPGQLPERKE